MTKFKSQKLKIYALISLVLVLGAGAAWTRVKAYQSESAPKVVAEAGSTVNLYEAQAETVLPEEPKLGSSQGSYLSNPYIQGERLVYIASQDAADLTTTTFSITPPDSFQKVTSTSGSEVAVRTDGGVGWTVATTTVTSVGINVTSPATTTLVYSCGASVAADRAPSLVLLTATMVTGTVGYIENNLTQALGGAVNGGTVSKITLNSTYPYFVCSVTAYDSNGIKNPSNTYVADITVEMSKNR